jgi:hypothetical protein
MYQSLIWSFVLCHDAGCVGASFHAEDLKRLADTLVHRVWGNFELGGDLFRGKMEVDEAHAIELARG